MSMTMAKSGEADTVKIHIGEEEEEKDEEKKTEVLKCPECSSIFKHKTHLRRHVKASHTMTDEDLIICPADGCHREMFRRDSMQRHISLVHKLDASKVLPPPRPLNAARKPDARKSNLSTTKHFKCMLENCEIEFSRREHLRRHIKNVHKKDPLEVMGAEAYATRRIDRKQSSITTTFVNNEELTDDNDFDMPIIKNEVKGEEDREQDAMLCIFCCYSFYADNIYQMEDLSENLQFNKLISEVLPSLSCKEDHSDSSLFNSLNGLSVCSDCRLLTNTAMEKKFLIDELEITVRQLQHEILHKMEMLQERLSEYFLDMKNIEKVISGADVCSLKSFLQRNKMDEKKGNDNFALLLRDAVVTATNKLENYKYIQTQEKVLDPQKISSTSIKNPPIHLPSASKISKRSSRTSCVKKEPESNDDTAELMGDSEDFEVNHDDGDGFEHEDPDFNVNDISNSENEDSDYSEHVELSENSAVGSGKEEDCQEINQRGVKRQKVVNEVKKKGKRKKVSYNEFGDVDTSGWSDFKVKLLRKSIHLKSTWTAAKEQTKRFPDPRQNFLFEYNQEKDNFVVGQIPVLINDSDKSLKCSECEYTVIDGQLPPKTTVWHSIQKHIQLKHMCIFKCPICPGSRSFGNYKRYSEHLTGHTGDIKCDKCERTFVTEKSLTAHIWNKHMTPEEIEEALQQGQKDPRTKKRDPSLVPRQQCSVCGKHVINLTIHMEVHLDREPLLCGTCGSTFVGKASLYHHQSYSCFPPGKEPPRAECDQCSRSFKSKVLLARHIRDTHSQAALERAFKCELCRRGFASMHQLKKHMIVHSDDRPFVCRNGCGADYKTGRHRTRHEKLCNGEFTGKIVARKRK